MKNHSNCSKCGSSNILKIEGQQGLFGTGNIIPIESTFKRKSVKVNRYVCCACGFSEEWIDMQDIPLLEEKFR